MYIAQNDCSYLKSLLSLFPKAEDLGDYGSLATLAACVKTILLLNEPGIIELIVMDEVIFEEVCSTLEYDPDLRDKADHRWFLRERVKFRTVTLMEDEELISAIHRSFRVCYMRDTLLRPTMDESSLSTLSSLQTFTHADVVKGVTMSPVGSDEQGELLRDSYLAKVREIICNILFVLITTNI
jgi:protein phosphatase 4 regulatory subunit 3